MQNFKDEHHNSPLNTIKSKDDIIGAGIETKHPIILTQKNKYVN